MGEAGIQDFIGILNVTINGLEHMGHLSLSVTKGTAEAVVRISQVAKWVGKAFSDEKKVGGRLKNQSIARRFSDLRYSEVQLLSPETIYMQLNEMYPGNYDLAKIKILLNPLILQKKFDELAQKHGLLYARVPNFIPNKQTGVTEFKFAYSSSQTNAKDATLEQMQAYIAKQLKKCGAKQKVAKKYAEAASTNKDTSFTESLPRLGVEKISDEQFQIAMKETYPGYAPELLAQEPTEERKKEYLQFLSKSEAAEAAPKPVKEQDTSISKHSQTQRLSFGKGKANQK